MRRAERVENALASLGETRQPARGAQRMHPRASAGQNLVRVGLMANVPDQLVVRRIENIVQRDGELDDPQPCPQMAADAGDETNSFRTEFCGDGL